MPEYFEFHISRKNLERMIFISIIVIALLVSIFAWKKDVSCPEVECPESEVEEVVEEEPEEEPEPVVEETEEESVTYYADIKNYNIAPPELTIRKGSTIIFKNGENALVHKLYELKGLFFSPRLEPDDEFSFTFNETGNYTIWSIMGKDKGTRMEVEVVN